MSYMTAVYSGKGGRTYNEDCVYVQEEINGLTAILADGLGMHGGGDIASQTAVKSMAEAYKERHELTEEALNEYFKQAHEAILKKQTAACRMKSTAVMLICQENQRVIAHTGDSRGYYFQDKKLVFQTTDHSVSQLAVLSGEISSEEIRFHPDRNRLLHALGEERKIRVDIRCFQTEPPKDEAFLLCSDGFWEYVTEKEMMIDLLKSEIPQDWIAYMLARIGARVKEKNDNLSAIAVFCRGGKACEKATL